MSRGEGGWRGKKEVKRGWKNGKKLNDNRKIFHGKKKVLTVTLFLFVCFLYLHLNPDSRRCEKEWFEMMLLRSICSDVVSDFPWKIDIFCKQTPRRWCFLLTVHRHKQCIWLAENFSTPFDALAPIFPGFFGGLLYEKILICVQKRLICVRKWKSI